jgi:predicted nucleic acid-binding protein
LLVDTSVARNFAIAGWADYLVTLSQGVIRVAQGVLGVGPDEPGELDRAKEFFERQTRTHPVGSHEYTNALTAAMNLENLISRRSTTLEVVVPTEQELRLAVRLQAREERGWRTSLGMRARRLDAGEAVSVAICVSRNEEFGCDDEDGRIAYRALGGKQSLSTLDFLKVAVHQGLLPQDEARAGYEKLRGTYRFFGPPWPGGHLGHSAGGRA